MFLVSFIFDFSSIFQIPESFFSCTRIGTLPSFPAMLSKGNNSRDFLFSLLEDQVFPKLGLLLK